VLFHVTLEKENFVFCKGEKTMTTRYFSLVSFLYGLFGIFFGWIAISQLQLFSGIAVSHNLLHFIAFWCAFLILWSVAFICVSVKRILKRSEKYRIKEIGLSYIFCLIFLGIFIFAEFHLLPLIW